jgi:hypothetical protein
MSKVKTTVLRGLWRDSGDRKNPIIRVELIEGWTLNRVLDGLNRAEKPRIQETVGFKVPSHHVYESQLKLGAVIRRAWGTRLKSCSASAVHASRTAYHMTASNNQNDRRRTVWLVCLPDGRPADYTKWYGKEYTVIGTITIRPSLFTTERPYGKLHKGPERYLKIRDAIGILK